MIEGQWSGEYTYLDSRDPVLLDRWVTFELQIEKSRFGSFTGITSEDSSLGACGVGIVEGRCWGGQISFTRRMPIFSVFYDGRSMLLSEYIAQYYGEILQHELPHPNLHYQGRWEVETKQFRGTWHLEPRYVFLANGGRVLFGGAKGEWCMQQSLARNLLRAAESPIQDQQAILLRAATDKDMTPVEELVQPVDEQA